MENKHFRTYSIMRILLMKKLIDKKERGKFKIDKLRERLKSSYRENKRDSCREYKESISKIDNYNKSSLNNAE